MSSAFRYDGTVQDPTGLAIPGASVAVLTDPSDFSTQPGTPLATIYAAGTSNSATVTNAVWAGGQITFTLSTTPPSDIVTGSFIAVSGVTPSAFNTTLEDPYLVVSVSGNNVVVVSLTSPGTYVSGGTVATSVLPNPTSTDNNGNYFFYAAPGQYGVQIYSPTITERDFPDQGVGTVAGGSVLSVGLTMPAIFSVSGSPVTTTGTLAVTLANENANLVFAGPTSGGAAAPTFRSLVAADLPAGTGSVTSVAHTLTVPGIFTSSVVGSPVTGSGTLADTITLATQTANTVFAGASSGGAAQPSFRALVTADLPAVTTPGNTLSGSTDAVTFPSQNFVTTSGIDAMTLATPVATTDDFKIVFVCDEGGHAHTITTASNKIVPSHHLVTFGGTAGSFVYLIAYQGLWYPLANSGVTIT